MEGSKGPMNTTVVSGSLSKAIISITGDCMENRQWLGVWEVDGEVDNGSCETTDESKGRRVRTYLARRFLSLTVEIPDRAY